MSWFSDIFKGIRGLAGEAAGATGAEYNEAVNLNKIFEARKASPFPKAPRITKSGAIHAQDIAKGESYSAAISPLQEEAKGMDRNKTLGSLFKASDDAPGVARGAMIGAGAAAAGSLFFGGAHLMSPNNADVDNPIRNLVRGALVGGVAAGAMMISHNATISKSFTKAANADGAAWWMKKTAEFAPGVKSTMNSPVAKGAIAAGLIAGSGQFDLTRPVNPVY